MHLKPNKIADHILELIGTNLWKLSTSSSSRFPPELPIFKALMNVYSARPLNLITDII